MKLACPELPAQGMEALTGASLGSAGSWPGVGAALAAEEGTFARLLHQIYSGFQRPPCCQTQWSLCRLCLTLSTILIVTTLSRNASGLASRTLCTPHSLLLAASPVSSARSSLDLSLMSSSVPIGLPSSHVLVTPKLVSQAQMLPMCSSLIVLTTPLTS